MSECDDKVILLRWSKLNARNKINLLTFIERLCWRRGLSELNVEDETSQEWEIGNFEVIVG